MSWPTARVFLSPRQVPGKPKAGKGKQAGIHRPHPSSLRVKVKFMAGDSRLRRPGHQETLKDRSWGASGDWAHGSSWSGARLGAPVPSPVSVAWVITFMTSCSSVSNWLGLEEGLWKSRLIASWPTWAGVALEVGAILQPLALSLWDLMYPGV